MLHQKTAVELRQLLDAKEISAREVTHAFLDRAQKHNEECGAFLCFNEFDLDQQVELAQKKIDEGQAGLLTGIPVAIKDNISTQGIETTCASEILQGYVPPFDAHVVENLRADHAIILGKANLDEFAMGSSNENSAFGPAKNPWDLNRVPGGSSGGSATAVAAGLAPLALGSDTGGSIRLPAAFSGLVGFKPTYGRVSRYGLVAFGSSLDQIGPISRTVLDAAWLAARLSGSDHRDSTSLPMDPIDPSEVKNGSLQGKRLALPKELVGESVDRDLLSVVQAAIDKLTAAGAVVEEVSIPEIELGVTTYYIIAPAEASSNLARFDGVRYGQRLESESHLQMMGKTRGQLFGHEVKARIMIGTYVLSAGYYDAYYLRAQQARAKMAAATEMVLKSFDAIIGPTSPIIAPKIGEMSGDPMALKVLDFCTIPANMGGNPAISIPCGFTANMPVGLQLMGAVAQDEALLALAYASEQVLDSTRVAPWP